MHGLTDSGCVLPSNIGSGKFSHPDVPPHLKNKSQVIAWGNQLLPPVGQLPYCEGTWVQAGQTSAGLFQETMSVRGCKQGNRVQKLITSSHAIRPNRSQRPYTQTAMTLGKFMVRTQASGTEVRVLNVDSHNHSNCKVKDLFWVLLRTSQCIFSATADKEVFVASLPYWLLLDLLHATTCLF